MSSPIRRVAVVGAGTMGHGIAYVALAAGYEVALADSDRDALLAAHDRIAESFAGAIERNKLSAADRDAGLARLSTFPALEPAAAEADLLIEAVPERIELKRSLFSAAYAAAPPHAILASNTSSLSIGAIAAAVPRPERVVGLHFFNPVAAMRLVEIVRGAATSEATVDLARTFAESLGKTPIVVRDSPGFATSRLGVALGLEAVRMLEAGVASASDIDRAMELGYNHPVGPLRLGDIVGLDVRLAIADHLHATLGSEVFRAPELLRRMVAEGRLGRKSGEGFYRWEDGA
ncbi:MAG TPA: 3-hydroxyacyl-CoA dehydrogenase family protein [Gemmatimonadales bacterium]|nr:3-hydroxyacyl-CoA dehydrogenase family protein [Gemmatimonadales bacterium]